MTALRAWIRALEASKQSADFVLPGLLEQLAELHGDRFALLSENDVVSYQLLAVRVNRCAQWAIEAGLAGQTVALLLRNCPNYVAIWLGLTRVGCKVALLNTNLRRNALLHCIKAVDAESLIGSSDLTDAVSSDVRVFSETSCWSKPGSIPWPLPRSQDVALYIYTSGTTGLPKAVKITHRRIVEWSYWFAGMEDAQPTDCLYDCLPMYHSIGGIVAIGSMLVVGGSVVIRERFSASNFWQEIESFGCTIFQYIGELCRYLVQTAPSNFQPNHTLRLAVGNGLQADVWEEFKNRFAIPQVLEYYAATEGVLSLYNCEGKPGAIGRIPPALERHFGVKLIQVEQETGEPLRNEAGFCVASERDLPGEAIAAVRPDRPFDGYHDADASSRKILTDVFVAGDRWYRTGDLMRRDAAGFYYFVDRLGDTFRWKGENVSTTEVANVVRACSGVLDAIVYGVQLPGQEGRAGMAAITTTDDFSLEALAAHLMALPSYARPMFVRWCRMLDATSTFKLTKGRYAKESFTSSTDPVYGWRDGSFKPLVAGSS